MCTVHLAMYLNISMLDNVTPLAHLPLSASENMIKTMSSKEDNVSIVKEAVSPVSMQLIAPVVQTKSSFSKAYVILTVI